MAWPRPEERQLVSRCHEAAVYRLSNGGMGQPQLVKEPGGNVVFETGARQPLYNERQYIVIDRSIFKEFSRLVIQLDAVHASNRLFQRVTCITFRDQRNAAPG